MAATRATDWLRGLIDGGRLFHRLIGWLCLLPLLGTGCGTFIAHRMVQAPNSYPTWLAPAAPVLLAYDDDLLTNSPSRFAEVGPPAARLRYRVVEPADYHLQVIATNWEARGRTQYQFEFRTGVRETNHWTVAPRGTVVLLHGYALAEFAMVPWALCLAQDGWRCVLVDLRGHGRSTGKTISYGITEVRDLSQLLDRLTNGIPATAPVAVMGDSYGAALALRWKTTDPRLGKIVALAPYGVLSNAMLNICHDYARFLPRALIRAGVKQLPSVLGVPDDELDTTTVLARHPVTALFVAGAKDNIIPAAEVRRLFDEALPDSKFILVPGATHETLPYHFSELAPPVLAWLRANSEVEGVRFQGSGGPAGHGLR